MEEHSTIASSPNNEFLKKLDEEKLKHKEHRHEFVKLKLMYIIGLFSLGSLTYWNQISSSFLQAGNPVDLSVLLYSIPFVALAFDIFIFSEDFKVKRIGVFIGTEKRYSVSDEAIWEKWLAKKDERREKVTLIASGGLTLMTIISSSFFLRPKNQNDNIYIFSWWFAACMVLGMIVFGFSLYRRSQLLKETKEQIGS